MTEKHNSKLSPDRHERLVRLLKAGNHRETAARAVGISPSSLRTWMARGRKGEEPYASLAADIDKAEAEVEVGNVATILSIGRGKPTTISADGVTTKGTPSDWRAIGWWLERRHRTRYGQQVTINVEETKDELLQAVAAVCARHDDGESIFAAILNELEGGNSKTAGDAAAVDVH